MATTGYHHLPGFPPQLAATIPRPDGAPGPRDADAPFGPAYMRDRQRRAILVLHDLVAHFVMLVAGRTQREVSAYWTGDASGRERLDDLVANALLPGAEAGGASLAAALPPNQLADLRDAFSRAADITSARMVYALAQQQSEAEAHAALAGVAGAGGAAVGVRDPHGLGSSDFYQRSADEMTRAYDLSRAAGAKAATRAAPAQHAYVPAAVPAAGAPAPAQPPAAAGPPIRERPAEFSQVLAANPQAVPRTAAQAGADEQLDVAELVRQYRARLANRDTGSVLSTLDARGRPVYGVDDKEVMLLRLMLNGGTETQLKMWHRLYGVPEPPPASARPSPSATPLADLTTSAGRLRYLHDLAQVQKMLQAGAGSLNWAEAPPHTGWMFFKPVFSSAVSRAMALIHGPLCGHPEVAEIDLMTHERVRDAFADLVALMLTQASASVSTRRFGGGTAAERDELDLQRKAWIRRFRTLTVGRDGYLAFADSVDYAAQDARHRTERTRRRHMAETGGYFSDAPGAGPGSDDRERERDVRPRTASSYY